MDFEKKKKNSNVKEPLQISLLRLLVSSLRLSLVISQNRTLDRVLSGIVSYWYNIAKYMRYHHGYSAKASSGSNRIGIASFRDPGCNFECNPYGLEYPPVDFLC